MPTHNLPFQSTSFVGRDKELMTIRQTLAEAACRLLVLLGPGGIGKTRLAARFMSQSSSDFAQETYFVDLAALSSPDSLVLTIANVLQLRFYEGQDPQQQLLQYLSRKSILLVLDSFEHLLDGGAELVSTILTATTNLRLLVTSR